MIRVGVVGGTGYTGVELLRLLLRHPGVSLELITSRGEAGRRLDDLFPSLLGVCDLRFTDPAAADYSHCDVVFFATPHNVAMREVPSHFMLIVRCLVLLNGLSHRLVPNERVIPLQLAKQLLPRLVKAGAGRAPAPAALPGP